MKALTAILFSVLFLLTTMQQTTLLLLYKLNEKAITEKYCVNKKTNSCCHGKCHLNKTIAKSESENNKNPFSTTNGKTKDVEVFYHSLQHRTEYIATQKRTISFVQASPLLKGFSFSLLKPPCVLG
jgi:hypothetical protein